MRSGLIDLSGRHDGIRAAARVVIARFSNFDFEVTAGTKSLTVVSNQPVPKPCDDVFSSELSLVTVANQPVLQRTI